MIFYQHSETYSLKISGVIEFKDLAKGLWIVLAGVDGIPPHIALVYNGKYYSVTARKVKAGEPIDKFLKAISRGSLPTLFVKLEDADVKAVEADLEKDFSKYPTLGNGEHTCHWPIRDFFSKAIAPVFANADLVFELLDILQDKRLLAECRSIYLDKNLQEIELPKYTLTHIRDKINSILKVNEQK